VDSVVGRKTRVQQRLGTLEGIDVTLASLIHYDRGRRRRGRLCRIRFLAESRRSAPATWSGRVPIRIPVLSNKPSPNYWIEAGV